MQAKVVAARNMYLKRNVRNIITKKKTAIVLNNAEIKFIPQYENGDIREHNNSWTG